MNPTPWWTGGRLLTAAVLLAGTGMLMLSTGLTSTTIEQPSRPRGSVAPTDRPGPTAPAPNRPTSSRASAPDVSPRTTSGSPWPATAAPTATAPSPADAMPGGAAPASQLPPPGEGPAADPLIQQALDRAGRSDLPPADEQHLVTVGRAAWLAETVRYTQVRIQATTARREPDRDGAVVRLVWAGADPAGTYLDGRTAALHYIRNGEGSWTRT
ncbi:hypothetical protein [Streptomyces virginiae]|uniref:hypothetical protein n=1 Tax=Streptomyces virginiae TaxID=1961 RepID=UPI00224CC0ED|nr:hypothetical protein [Streptomyces virginiae]MCX5174271.1 hypothetical protein [Streptomyces virginiae]